MPVDAPGCMAECFLSLHHRRQHVVYNRVPPPHHVQHTHVYEALLYKQTGALLSTNAVVAR